MSSTEEAGVGLIELGIGLGVINAIRKDGRKRKPRKAKRCTSSRKTKRVRQ